MSKPIRENSPDRARPGGAERLKFDDWQHQYYGTPH